MEFAVLKADADRARWQALIERLAPPSRDLHFLPEYASIYEKTYGHEGRLAYFGDGEQFVIQPFVVRRLNRLPFLAEQGIQEPCYDVANAYGYGGPLVHAASDAAGLSLFSRFDRHFRDYCSDHGFAAEFCSLHPLLGNYRLVMESGLIDVRLEKRVAYIDVTHGEDDLWRNVSRGHKSSISKGRRNGVIVRRVAADESNLAVFGALYRLTMERHAAAPKWRFPGDYFPNCIASLGPQRAALFFAEVHGAVAAAYLLLHDAITAYYHFGGSDSAYAALRPSNCLMYETALWARSSGKLYYHLGGGVTSADDDTLLRFKTGFGGATAPLHVYARVHDQRVYERLSVLKREHERMTTGHVEPDNYFPRYRQ